MRSWNLQQMAEKQSSDWETKEDEERYANYVKMLTERRTILEQEESDDRKQMRQDVARENMNLSLQKEQNRKVLIFVLVVSIVCAMWSFCAYLLTSSL